MLDFFCFLTLVRQAVAIPVELNTTGLQNVPPLILSDISTFRNDPTLTLGVNPACFTQFPPSEEHQLIPPIIDDCIQAVHKMGNPVASATLFRIYSRTDHKYPVPE